MGRILGFLMLSGVRSDQEDGILDRIGLDYIYIGSYPSGRTHSRDACESKTRKGDFEEIRRITKNGKRSTKEEGAIRARL